MLLFFTVFALTTGVFLIAILGLGIGTLVRKQTIRGSCGGCSNFHCKRNQS